MVVKSRSWLITELALRSLPAAQKLIQVSPSSLARTFDITGGNVVLAGAYESAVL